MKCANLSKILVVSLAVFGCTGSGMVGVSRHKYSEDLCWFGRNSRTEAFLVFGGGPDRYVPYLISSKCYVIDKGQSIGVSTVTHLGEVAILDRNGVLQKMYPNMKIVSGISSDEPTPSSDSKVYYIQISGGTYYLNGRRVVVPGDIIVRDIAVTFGAFLGLSRDRRIALLENQ